MPDAGTGVALTPENAVPELERVIEPRPGLARSSQNSASLARDADARTQSGQGLRMPTAVSGIIRIARPAAKDAPRGTAHKRLCHEQATLITRRRARWSDTDSKIRRVTRRKTA
jgi:hypothetical protein